MYRNKEKSFTLRKPIYVSGFPLEFNMGPYHVKSRFSPKRDVSM